MKYRPEIDGLRAIAVILVVLYHANSAVFTGGYLGVDVFFVISGFLITQVIVGDLKKDRFSFVEFYERRARRILPALYFVLAVTIPFAFIWMLPSQREDFAQSILATTLFSSNFLFWTETGYFMAASELKPLLHTWSLAVEEQFYFVYPVFIYLLWRFAKPLLIPALIVLFLASLAATSLMAEHDPGANFYLLPTRMWELLAGAIIALVGWYPQKGAQWLALLGLTAIFASFVVIDTTIPIPSIYGLPLILGTQLVLISATGTTLVKKVLAWRPLAAIGLISYSAYLWHLPLFTFARLRSLGDPEPLLLAGLGLAAFGMAFISYHLVEKPFRRRGENALISRRQLALLLTFIGALFVGFGVLFGTYKAQLVFPGDFRITSLADSDVEAKLVTNYGLSEDCEGSFTLSKNCRTSEAPEVLLWGDSFAMQLAPAIVAGTTWQGVIQHTMSVCSPVVGVAIITPNYPAEWSRGCIDFNDQVIDWLREQDHIKHVVMSSPFILIYDDLHNIYMRDGTIVSENQKELVRQQLLETGRIIKEMGKSLVIVSPTPVTGVDIGQCLAASVQRGQPEDSCDFIREYISERNHEIYDFLRRVESEIPVLFLDEFICDDVKCDTMMDGVFIYRDAGHLSVEGSAYLGEKFNLYGRIMELADDSRAR